MTVDTFRSGFGDKFADCSKCELAKSCARRTVEGERPEDWEEGGLMIIGEAPSDMEASHGRPFQGPSGRLLDALLEAVGFRREACWLTNTVLGVLPRMDRSTRETKGGKSLHDRFPLAIYSCLPRIEQEIAKARPRVIVTLGPAPLTALTGREIVKTRFIANTCGYVLCDDKTRKLTAPCLVCANGACNWYEVLNDPDPKVQAVIVKDMHNGKCPKCAQSISRLQPRAMKCPKCAGKKRKEERFTTFSDPYTLVGRNGVAGAVFTGEELDLSDYGVKYVVPTYHPSFCLHSAKDSGSKKTIGGQHAAAVMVDHLSKAKRLLTRDAMFAAHALTTRDPQVVRDWFARAQAINPDVACDIETNAIGGPWAPTKITVIGFASADMPEALVVDVRHFQPGWNEGDPLMEVLVEVLTSSSIGKVFHHGSYDRLVILRLWGIEVENTTADTLLEHHCLHPDAEQGLGFVAHRFLDAPAWKEGSHTMPKDSTHDLSGYSDIDQLALYNARDTRSTALVDRVMRGADGKGRMSQRGVERAHELDLDMQRIAIRMESVGLPVSTERFRSIEAACLNVMDTELREMRSMIGVPDFVPRGAALLDALFNPAGPLRLPITARTPTGEPSAAKDALMRMEHPFISHLLKWRKYEYSLSHYVRGEGLAPLGDGRIHPQWKVHGTVTGRWSSSPNFQNWPKGDGVDEATNLRSAIVAPPGRVIVGADYAQLEMRIMASLSGDSELIRRCMEADESDKLNPEKDPHSYVARLAFGAAFTSADKNQRKALRDVAKRVVYGLNYGAGAQTILAAIYDGGYEGPPLTVRLIEAVIAAYFKGFPGVPTWRDNQIRSANLVREVRSPLIGRYREFPLGDLDSTVACNFPIQSGASDIMNTRLGVLDRSQLRVVDPTAEFIAQVHDAIYIEVDERKVHLIEPIVAESLSVTLALVEGAKPMDYIATPSHARSWDKAA